MNPPSSGQPHMYHVQCKPTPGPTTAELQEMIVNQAKDRKDNESHFDKIYNELVVMNKYLNLIATRLPRKA